MKQHNCSDVIKQGKKELKQLMSAAANGGRASSMDGGRMGLYKLNNIRGTVYKN